MNKLKANTGLLAILSAALVFAPCGTAHSRHPIHVSVTEIEYDPAEKELEIMIRIFIDDLETALRRFHHQDDIDILNAGKTAAEKLIATYLEDNFIISIDNRQQSTRYLGHETEGQAFICYVLVPGIGSWKECEVTNSILQEMFDDQSNIVHVTQNGVTKSLRLVPHNPKGKFAF